jgi:NAD(P)-dependent dehydrogenase (short-subunit alcohol dehydrogenase family)
MPQRVWLVTGVSSGLGRHIAERLLARGELVVGTVGKPDTVADLSERYPSLLRVDVLDVATPPLRAPSSNAPSALSVRSTSGSAISATGCSAPQRYSLPETSDAALDTNLATSIQLIPRSSAAHARDRLWADHPVQLRHPRCAPRQLTSSHRPIRRRRIL